MRRALEIAAVVVGFLALREVINVASDHLDRMTPNPETLGTPFYWIWLAVLVALAWRWPATRPRLAPHFRGRRDLALLVAAFIVNEWFYGWRAFRLVAGDAHFCHPHWLTNSILFAPLVEEWLFRGVLWDLIAKRSHVVVAWLATAVLFAVWHWTSLFHPSWTGGGGTPLVVHFTYGLFLGLLRWRFGSIGIGMALHAIGNGWSSYTTIP